MERLEDKVRQRCVELIGEIAGQGHCDFLRDFAWRYPTSIFMELMGLPADGLGQFLAWEHAILHPTAGDDPERSGALEAMLAVMVYFAELLEEKRRSPADDLLSASLSWRIDGEPIAHEDLLSWCLLMFMAGLDTVSIQLSYAFWHLATHPDDRQVLATDAVRRAGGSGGVPAPVRLRGALAQGDAGRRLPRLPAEEGRHGLHAVVWRDP